MKLCPRCDTQTVRWLEVSSRVSAVLYYRCEACGHVWTVAEAPSEMPSVLVTTKRPEQAIRPR